MERDICRSTLRLHRAAVAGLASHEVASSVVGEWRVLSPQWFARSEFDGDVSTTTFDCCQLLAAPQFWPAIEPVDTTTSNCETAGMLWATPFRWADGVDLEGERVDAR